MCTNGSPHVRPHCLPGRRCVARAARGRLRDDGGQVVGKLGRGRQCGKDAAFANAVSTLYANIGFMGVDDPLCTVVVTSTVPEEGKSTIALALARAMAASGKRTLLLECDLRSCWNAICAAARSHAWQACALISAGGLWPWVTPRCAGAASPAGGENLFLLDAEPDLPSPADLLDSARFRALFDALARTFDDVLVDTPPVGAFVDAAVVASQADATVLVVREGYVRGEGVALSLGSAPNSSRPARTSWALP